MKQESSGCLELNRESVWMLHQHISCFFLYILLKIKNMMNILNISFIEGIKTTGNRKKTSLLSMKEKQLQHLKCK